MDSGIKPSWHISSIEYGKNLFLCTPPSQVGCFSKKLKFYILDIGVPLILCKYFVFNLIEAGLFIRPVFVLFRLFYSDFLHYDFYNADLININIT